MLELFIAPAARADLLGIWDSIAEENLDAADRFLFANEQAMTQLTRHPGLGRERRFARFRGTTLRSWSVKGFRNYLVFYYPTQDCLYVVRVVHGAELGSPFPRGAERVSTSPSVFHPCSICG